jgi:hypothetical protein
MWHLAVSINLAVNFSYRNSGSHFYRNAQPVGITAVAVMCAEARFAASIISNNSIRLSELGKVEKQ